MLFKVFYQETKKRSPKRETTHSLYLELDTTDVRQGVIQAREIMRELLTLISGYMVPKLAREIGGEPSKTPLDLGLKQR